MNTDLATTPHQPYMFIYDTMMIVLVFWLGKQYASWREHGMRLGWIIWYNAAPKLALGCT
ncbi:hypothetical protein [Secundilactobacillus similis]|uniref:hypothetical protein n=1 Tax=Secundilactobacillus similis TaxID=414682 RepID=UPI0006D05C27|nr:hypothetical protein [Secundilactobacillus similis]